jgi:hypothetical protein
MVKARHWSCSDKNTSLVWTSGKTKVNAMNNFTEMVPKEYNPEYMGACENL